MLNEEDLPWKTTSVTTFSSFEFKFSVLKKIGNCPTWRWPQLEEDLKILVRSSSYFKLKLRGGQNQNWILLIWRRPQDIQSDNQSNLWSDLIQILTFNFLIEYCLKWRRPPIEDDLKTLKLEYLSNNWSNLPQILIFSWGD